MRTLVATLLFVAFLAGCMLSLSSCSNDNEDAERLARKEREMQQIIRDSEAAEKVKQQQQVPDVEVSPEPEAPAEPQYEEVTAYYFTSATEKTQVKCVDAEQAQCGMTFSKCSSGKVYYCQVGVSYVTKDEKVLVTD